MLELETEHMLIADDARSQLPLLWVPTTEQLADELTKRSNGEALRKLLSAACFVLRQSTPDATTRACEAKFTSWRLFVTQWWKS